MHVGSRGVCRAVPCCGVMWRTLVRLAAARPLPGRCRRPWRWAARAWVATTAPQCPCCAPPPSVPPSPAAGRWLRRKGPRRHPRRIASGTAGGRRRRGRTAATPRGRTGRRWWWFPWCMPCRVLPRTRRFASASGPKPAYQHAWKHRGQVHKAAAHAAHACRVEALVQEARRRSGTRGKRQRRGSVEGGGQHSPVRSATI